MIKVGLIRVNYFFVRFVARIRVSKALDRWTVGIHLR